jgi:hypothetical protein
MAENKTAKTPADGPEYERGFVDGMQRQMQLSVKINKEPTKIFGPGLEELLNRAGFFRKREWVGLTDEERHSIREWQEIQKELGPVWAPMMLYLYLAIEAKLKEKNHG